MKTDRPETFGSLLRQYRTTAGLTQEQLAERAGLSGRAVSDLERGARTKPWRGTVTLLADALQLSTEQRSSLEDAIRRGRATPGERVSQPSSLESLPAEMTPLLGREQDEAGVVHLLRRGDIRVLTLTGPGGVGKTRVALRVARTESSNFSDGVCFVPLAPVRQAEHVPNAVAAALGLHDVRGQSALQTIVRALRPRQMLVLLDNLEHLLDATPFVLELVTSCPKLTLLITSRAPLHIQGEQEFPIPPLSVPHTDSVPASDLPRYSASALFLARALAVSPSFSAATDGAAVAHICRRLDGLPLAIELAAARLKYESLQELAVHLDSRFEVLIDGPRGLPPRQQAMRDCIAWSYNLLQADEQLLFRRLAVFVGEYSRHTVETVCGYGLLSQARAGFALTALIDKSLLVVSGRKSAQLRFSMLETIREYAFERLTEQGEVKAVCESLARYVVALAEEAWRERFRADEAVVFRRLDTERDNVDTVLAWASEHDPDTGLNIASALFRYWIINGRYKQWRVWIEQMLAKHRVLEPRVRCRSAVAAGWLSLHEGQIERAAKWYHESLGSARHIGDVSLTFTALEGLGMVAVSQGRGPEAASLFREVIRSCRDQGTSLSLGPPLYGLGLAFQVDGDLDQARTAMVEAIEFFRADGERFSVGAALRAMGGIALAQGRYDEAVANYRDGLEAALDVRHREGIASALDGISAALAVQGSIVAAARTWGAATAMHEELFGPVSSNDDVPLARLPQLSPHLHTVSAHFADPRWAPAQAEGAMTPLEQTISSLKASQVR